jgi:hypothetical protein
VKLFESQKLWENGIFGKENLNIKIQILITSTATTLTLMLVWLEEV